MNYNNQYIEVKKFYSEIAPYYDTLMIDSFNSIATYRNSRKMLIDILNEDGNIKDIVDCGCGTGIDMILMSKAGFNLLGCDISKEMLDMATKNNSRLLPQNKLRIKNIDFINKLSDLGTNKFDALTCLGNSLYHVFSTNKLISTIKGFYNVLKTHGLCLIEVDNLDTILKVLPKYRYAMHFEKIYNFKNNTFIAYDKWQFCKHHIISHVYLLNDSSDYYNIQTFKLPFRPYELNKLISILHDIGFREIEIKSYGISHHPLQSIIFIIDSKEIITRYSVIIKCRKV